MDCLREEPEIAIDQDHFRVEDLSSSGQEKGEGQVPTWTSQEVPNKQPTKYPKGVDPSQRQWGFPSASNTPQPVENGHKTPRSPKPPHHHSQGSGVEPRHPFVVNPLRGSFASLTSFVRLTTYKGSATPFCKEVDL